MELTLESYVDGKPVSTTKEIDPRSTLGQMVSNLGWPEVIIHMTEAYTIQEFDPTSAKYLRVTVFINP